MRRSRRARAEARAPMRGSSRVCRGVWRSRRCPARCAALRGAARRRGAARSSCAAAGCWCPAPAPPPSRGRCAQQPRAAGALCPLRRRAAGRAVAATARPTCPPAPGSPVATQIAQQPHRAATRHFFVAGPTRLATILPRASRRARPLPSTRMADALEHQHRTAWLIFYFSPSIFLCVSTVSWSADAAPSRRGLLVPCACSAAGRPAAPSPPLAWCCAAAAGFAMARVASAVPEHERLGRWAFPCWTGFRLAKSADSCRILSLVYSGTKKKGPTTSPSPIRLVLNFRRYF